MNATADGPSAGELDQLSGLLTAPNSTGGPWWPPCGGSSMGSTNTSATSTARAGCWTNRTRPGGCPCPARTTGCARRCRRLLLDAQSVRQAAADGSDEDLRRRGGELLAGLRGHRDAEASLVLENAATEVGSGD